MASMFNRYPRGPFYPAPVETEWDRLLRSLDMTDEQAVSEVRRCTQKTKAILHWLRPDGNNKRYESKFVPEDVLRAAGLLRDVEEAFSVDRLPVERAKAGVLFDMKGEE